MKKSIIETNAGFLKKCLPKSLVNWFSPQKKQLQFPTEYPRNGFYYHCKHDDKNGPVNDYAYEVVGVGIDTEGGEPRVIYRPLYGNDIYAKGRFFFSRPLSIWLKTARYKGYDTLRFRQVTSPEVIAQLRAIKTKMYP